MKPTASEGGARVQDPIRFEVFKNSLIGLADEMGVVMMRTAHSTIATSAQDFSTAICDARGAVMAQGNTILLHLGTISDAVGQVVAVFQDDIAPGDVFIFNETNRVAQHLPDIYLIKACHFDDTLVGFAVCMSHSVDVGGIVPGSMAPYATDIFQEGIQIPLVKLYERGQLNNALREMLLANVRLPELTWGDLQGQMAACTVGARGLTELAHRYGASGLNDLGIQLFDYTERLTRNEIRSIPDGNYSFEDWLDDDGVGNGPVRLFVTIRIQGDSAIVDWDGSAPQAPSALNCHLTNTRSVSWGALQGGFGDAIPSNHGFTRAISVIAPPGTIVNPVGRAARGVRGVTTSRMMDVLLGALAKALPSRIPAAGDGGVNPVRFAGVNQDGEQFISFAGAGWGCWGGRPDKDGIEGVSPFVSNMAFFGVEDTEQTHGLMIERYGFMPDSGGAGKWRGGLALFSDVRFTSTRGIAVLRSARRKFLPYGLHGGEPGTPSQAILNRGTPRQRTLPLNGVISLEMNDVIRYVAPGGGGFGDPLDRDPKAVLEDVIEEKLTPAYALRHYGVRIDPVSREITDVRGRLRRKARRKTPASEVQGKTEKT